MSGKLTIGTLIRKVTTELEKGDLTPTAIQHVTGLGFKDIARAVNYMRMYGHIENRGEALHLRPAAPDAPAPEALADQTAAADQEAPAPATATVRTLKADPARRAELRADLRLQNLIAARRAEHPDAFMAAPTFGFGEANLHVGTFVRHPDNTLLLHAWEGSIRIVDFWTGDGIKAATGRGDTLRAAYAAAWQDLRLAKYDKGELLHKLARKNQVITEAIGAWIQTARDADTDLTAARAQRRRALLTARARGPRKSAAPVAAVAPVIDVPELHWSDANTLGYLRKGWPFMTLDERDDNAVPLMNEIVANQRNNAWHIVVRAVQRASESKAVTSC